MIESKYEKGNSLIIINEKWNHHRIRVHRN